MYVAEKKRGERGVKEVGSSWPEARFLFVCSDWLVDRGAAQPVVEAPRPTDQFSSTLCHPYARKSGPQAVLHTSVRLAEHLTTLRACCKQCLPCR